MMSFGYQPPPGAVATGWDCPADGCHAGNEDIVPRRWPFPCPECGTSTNPRLPEPWRHDARGFELRYLLAHAGDDAEHSNTGQLCLWRFEDALRNHDATAAAQVRAEFKALDAQHSSDEWWARTIGYYTFISRALDAGDLDNAADNLMHWFGVSSCEGVEEDGGLRYNNCCRVIESGIRFLDTPGAECHVHAAAIRQRCLDFASSAYEVLPRYLQGDVMRVSRA